MGNPLSWVHPGFSVFAGEPLSPRDPEQLERLARYITRPPLAADSIRRHEGSIEITTRPDPRTGGRAAGGPDHGPRRGSHHAHALARGGATDGPLLDAACSARAFPEHKGTDPGIRRERERRPSPPAHDR